jgi:hypothetical protein
LAGRASRRARAVAVLLLAGLGLAGRAAAQTVLDFVTFDGIDYLRWADEPGRPLTRADLGAEFATVECAMTDDRRGCPFGMDAAAAFMPAGTKMFAVRGYRTDFRLAAVVNDRVFLYQAWRNRRAKLGAELYDVAGRVSTIQVQRGHRTAAAPEPPVPITSADDVEALVQMLLRATVRPPRPHAFGEPRYWLTLWLADGTTLERTYYAETGEVMDGVVVPVEFRRILDRYLGD